MRPGIVLLAALIQRICATQTQTVSLVQEPLVKLTVTIKPTPEHYVCPPVALPSRMNFIKRNPHIFPNPEQHLSGKDIDQVIYDGIDGYFTDDWNHSSVVDALYGHWVQREEKRTMGLTDLVLTFPKAVGGKNWTHDFHHHLRTMPNILTYLSEASGTLAEFYHMKHMKNLLPNYEEGCGKYPTLEKCFGHVHTEVKKRYEEAKKWKPFNTILRSGQECSLDAFDMQPQAFDSGSFGSIFEAKLRATGEVFAVKHIPLYCVSEHRLRVASEDELQSRLTIDHPNILTYECSFKDSDHSAYFVMKKLVGNALDHPPENDRLPDFAKSVLKATHYLHMNNIIHRDLKPDNILVDGQGNPYIADFGYAVKAGADGLTRGVAGSLPYIAPEIVFNFSSYGYEVDLWSLGITFYVLKESEFPFGCGREEYPIFLDLLFMKRASFNLKKDPNFNELFSILTNAHQTQRRLYCSGMFDLLMGLPYFNDHFISGAGVLRPNQVEH